MFSIKSSTSRWAWSVVILLALGFGACEVPTETELPLGKQIQMQISVGDGEPFVMENLGKLPPKVLQAMRELPGVEKIEMGRSHDENGQLTFDTIVWGEDIDHELLMKTVREGLHGVEGARLHVSDLHHTFKESWGEKIGRELFHLDRQEKSKAELHAEIVRRLEAEGFELGDIEIHEEDGHTVIRAEQSSGDEQDGTEDSTTIELKHDEN